MIDATLWQHAVLCSIGSIVVRFNWVAIDFLYLTKVSKSDWALVTRIDFPVFSLKMVTEFLWLRRCLEAAWCIFNDRRRCKTYSDVHLINPSVTAAVPKKNI